MSVSCDKSVIRKAIEGDRPSISRILLSNYEYIGSHIASKIPHQYRTEITVDDVRQEVLITVFRRIETLKSDSPSTLRSWLQSIAEHQVSNVVRRYQARKRGGPELRRVVSKETNSGRMANPVDLLSDKDKPPRKNAEHTEAVQAVKVNLSDLPSDQRCAVKLHYFDGESIEKTAAHMNRTAAAVSGLLQRARRTLKAALGRSSDWLKSK